jgi:hypothetical protein
MRSELKQRWIELCEVPAMSGAKKERWVELCELARTEQDPTKFMALIDEINRLLEERQRRLKPAQIPDVKSN